MIEQLYSDFDPDIQITAKEGKTFDQSTLDLQRIVKFEGVSNVSRVIDEIVVVKHEKKWVNARMVGVDSIFLKMSAMKDHMVDGDPLLKNKNGDFAIIGATLLDKLGGFIPERVGYETVQVYAPKRDAKMRLGSNPFKVRMVNVSGRMNFNREVNAERILVPLTLASELLNFENDLTAVYVEVKGNRSSEDVKEEIKAFIGPDFEVKTNYEKNELIYKTSKSEKLIVIIILVFIFILAAFNLIASITMLFVEKKENLKTLTAMGARDQDIFRIFFLEGVLISAKGIVSGLLLGYTICFAQLWGGFLEMPNSGGEAFPIGMNWGDGLLIISLVVGLSLLFSYFPVHVLMKRYKDEVI